MALGDKLKQILIERNITVKDFATQIGVPPTTLYSFIKRDSETGKLDLLVRICIGLNMNIEDFIGLETFDTPSDFEKRWKEITQQCNNSSESITIIHKTSRENQLLDHFKKLNQAGEAKAVEEIELLTKIPDYQKKYKPEQK